MDESKELKQLYTFLQGIIYFFFAIEIITFLLFKLELFNWSRIIVVKLQHIAVLNNIIYAKLFNILIIIIVSIGTKAKKKLDINIRKEILIPIFLSIILIIFSVYFYSIGAEKTNSLNALEILYIITGFIGIVLMNVGLDNISKLIKNKLLNDRFNIENESFNQNQKLIKTKDSINFPILFYYKNKIRKGWINVLNPFKGTIVLGVPGTGKTFSIIVPYIKQLLSKGYTAIIYDYKYPDLGKMAYNYFLLNKKKGIYNDRFKFHCINIEKLEYSKRVNPIHKKYHKTLGDCIETADSLLEALRKNSKNSGGDFFTKSAVNFLSCVFYFLSKYENGKYSTFPHALSFISLDYESQFNALFSMEELSKLLSPFKSAYDNEAFDQFEGQIGSLKIEISRLAYKESYWIFSGNDIDLKVSSKENPSLLILANSPRSESITSSLNALILNRVRQEVNEEGNLPCLIAADEFPTIYFHRVANLISTARSRKIAVLLGLQEIPQLVELYNKEKADTILAVIGNVFSGAVRKSETLDWLSKIFGKVKQLRSGMNVDRNKTSINFNENLDFLIPQSKIANLNTGEMVAQVMGEPKDKKVGDEYDTNSFNCRINWNIQDIKKEENSYKDIPQFYNFGSEEEKERILLQNYRSIDNDINKIRDRFNNNDNK